MKKLVGMRDVICSRENLYLAYEDAAQGKHYRTEVLAFADRLSENLESLRDDLLRGAYRVGPYREFYVQYPKPRLVMALGFRDRVAQWALYRQINPYIDKRFIPQSYGCRTGKGSLAAALQLLDWIQLISRKPDARDWAIVKCDVSKYFYRIDHRRALDVYAEYIDDPWLLGLIGKIIDNPDVPFGLPRGMSVDDCPRAARLYDVGMPIGNLTSQETANLFLNELDQYAKHTLRLHYYARYMDDFIALCRRDEAQSAFDAMAAYLQNALLLDMSPKARVLPLLQGCEFVGYRITPHGIRLRKQTERHIKRSLLHVADLYSRGALSLDAVKRTVRCHIGITQNVNGYNLHRWISDNVVFTRGSGTVSGGDLIGEPIREPEEGILPHIRPA